MKLETMHVYKSIDDTHFALPPLFHNNQRLAYIEFIRRNRWGWGMSLHSCYIFLDFIFFSAV